MAEAPLVTWVEGGTERTAQWRSQAGVPPPKRIVVADDTLKADAAYRLASEGTALLWRGDFQNARQLLHAMARRATRKLAKRVADAREAFNLHRMTQAQRARTLGMLLIPFEADHIIPLRRAPDVRAACVEALGPAGAPYLASLRDLLGFIGAHEWRRQGVEIPALGERIHPHYGVWSPVRGEYVDLVATAPLPGRIELAFDIGTGTGVLAAVLARRGVHRIVATDQDDRAIACAEENVARLRLPAVTVAKADLFPSGLADLVVCNPPWVPGRPSSPLEHSIYDLDSRMLKGFLTGLRDHLQPGGEGWLVLSDLAEHLGLRTRDELLAWIAASGLRVIDRMDVKPRHPRSADEDDPFHAARSRETTSLWRLAAA